MNDEQQVRAIVIHCNSIFKSFCSINVLIEGSAGLLREWNNIIMGMTDEFEIDTEPKLKISWHMPDGESIGIQIRRMDDGPFPVYQIIPTIPISLKSGDIITINFTAEA